MERTLIKYNSSDGGKKQIKTGVKLACKTVFIRSSTSDGHPMLLVRRRRARRYPSELLQLNLVAYGVKSAAKAGAGKIPKVHKKKWRKS